MSDARADAVVQTLWAQLIASTLVDAGVTTCVISPGSRSTPLVAALAAVAAAAPALELVSIIDERAAAFFALGVARATGAPTAIVCTSGSAAAHYLPAIVEASLAAVPLIVVTADRPPELHACGASQTIEQHGLYGAFVRGAFDLGAPTASALALRAVRRTLTQAITLARGPHPGPVHLDVPLRKPLEPTAPTSEDDRVLARVVAEVRAMPIAIAPARLVADRVALLALAAAIAAEPRGLIIAGAAPAAASAGGDAIAALAARAGYPVLAEAGSQLRFASRATPAATLATYIDHGDVLLAELARRGSALAELAPRLIIQLGAEPIAAGWAAAQPQLAGAARYILTEHAWRDPDSSARAVIIGEVAAAIATIAERVPPRGTSAFATAWRIADAHAADATNAALAAHPRNEGAVVRAAIAAAPPGACVQIGNSLPIRVVDQVCAGGAPRIVLTQRGAAGIDGLIASAAGATRGRQPVLLVLGDVSFAHDVGGLLAARNATRPLAIVVVDNGGGQIFAGLPVARANLGAAFDRHFVTAPELDPVAVAAAFGARGVIASTPAAVAVEVTRALATAGVTVIHAPVSTSGAHDVRRTTLELLASARKGLS